jgi:hypothetical protein
LISFTSGGKSSQAGVASGSLGAANRLDAGCAAPVVHEADAPASTNKDSETRNRSERIEHM